MPQRKAMRVRVPLEGELEAYLRGKVRPGQILLESALIGLLTSDSKSRPARIAAYLRERESADVPPAEVSVDDAEALRDQYGVDRGDVAWLLKFGHLPSSGQH